MLILVEIIFAALLVRLCWLLFCIHSGRTKIASKNRKSIKAAVVIGSGGHTTEMLRLVQALHAEKYSPRIYFLASNDTTSEVKIHKLEDRREGEYEVIRIPRSRNVSQSFITSFATTLYAVVAVIPHMLSRRPELILCNGPGTCIPICFIAFIMRILCICDNRIVFVESICRVKTLSLTGKFLLFFADELFVQWPNLKHLHKRVNYVGRLS
ncbi:UDP-N-acetylglucosamine transferase subunit ALG14 homolog [Bacillus rossius redtenbacheri]|uniref:UDP-N-acetylglucosamine transferase subunit ALG14 homolog n=1 Tax=Bacillus rossius redtenbacheri TaxID=93214 RepID=UPI002FDED9D6